MNRIYGNTGRTHEGIAFEPENENKSISTLSIKDNVKGKTILSFLEYFKESKEVVKDTNKLGTYAHNRSVLKKQKKYLKGKDLTFEEVNYHFLKKYEHYLRNKLGNTTNAVHANLKVIRKLMNAAVREEIIEPYANPFPRYKLAWEKTTKEYLTDEEIYLIETLDRKPTTNPILPHSSHWPQVFPLKKTFCSCRFATIAVRLSIKTGILRGDF